MLGLGERKQEPGSRTSSMEGAGPGACTFGPAEEELGFKLFASGRRTRGWIPGSEDLGIFYDCLYHTGGLSATFSIQGCMPESSRSLLNKARKIGIFSVHESYEEENSKEKNKKTKVPRKHSGASAPYLAWVVGLGPFVALWCGGFLLPVKSIFP